MRYYQKVQWLAVVFILLVGLVGCDSGDGGLTAPADVPTGSASPANFWVGRGGDKLEVYAEGGLLQITVPSGAYMLAYTTKLGTFQIVFSSEEGAFLAIGLLEGDEFVNVSLWKGGAIPATAVPDPEYSKEGVNVYCWPGSSNPVAWYNVFVFTNDTIEIIIMVNGKFVTNPFIVIIILTEPREVPEERPMCDGESFIITVKVTGPGTVRPRSTEVCANASESFKFTHDDRDFDPAQDQVLLDGVDVTAQVQILGNGDGHLVIHKVNKNMLLEVNFGP